MGIESPLFDAALLMSGEKKIVDCMSSLGKGHPSLVPLFHTGVSAYGCRDQARSYVRSKTVGATIEDGMFLGIQTNVHKELKDALPGTFSIYLGGKLPTVDPELLPKLVAKHSSSMVVNCYKVYASFVGQEEPLPPAWMIHPGTFSIIAYTLRLAGHLTGTYSMTPRSIGRRLMNALQHDPAQIIAERDVDKARDNILALMQVIKSWTYDWGEFPGDIDFWRGVDICHAWAANKDKLSPWIADRGMSNIRWEMRSRGDIMDTFVRKA